MLHVELSERDGAPARRASLVAWHQRFGRALKLPGAFAEFLTSQLGLKTSADPPAQVAAWLDAATVLTELVDIDGLAVVPGSQQRAWFTGYAIAQEHGHDTEQLANTWLKRICDSSLFLADSSGLATLIKPGPALSVEVKAEWHSWLDPAVIVALKIEITNISDVRVQLGSLGVQFDGVDPGVTPPMLSADQRGELRGEKDAMLRHRYSPALVMRALEAGESITGGHMADVPWQGPKAGTPELKVMVRDAFGTEQEPQVFGGLVVLPPVA